MTSRRGFLGFLGAAIAGATLDPDEALWKPGRKLISIPKPPSGVSIRFITGYDIKAMQLVNRLDVLYGMALEHPHPGCGLEAVTVNAPDFDAAFNALNSAQQHRRRPLVGIPPQAANEFRKPSRELRGLDWPTPLDSFYGPAEV